MSVQKKPKGLKVTPEMALALRLPKISLPEYGTVSDLEYNSEIIKFDPDRATWKLQQTVVSYFSEESLIPGMDETYWLAILKGRQSGSSTTCANCLLPLTMYSPGTTSGIIADERSRADEVFTRLNLAYNNWPDEIRTDRVTGAETRSLTLPGIDSRVIIRSAEQAGVGIGLSVENLVGTEPPMWADLEEAMSQIQPAMLNRKRSKWVQESTPQPLDAPSGQAWFEHWRLARRGNGRWRGAFFPYWDSKANRRPWPEGASVDLEEIRLLERYGKTDQWGHPGLTLENLAFRRWTMETDSRIKRNPAMFDVWYPSNDISCWITQDGGIIPPHIIDLIDKMELQEESTDGLTIFKEPDPNATYVIGADPAGYGRDHSAFQVLEVWDDEWLQVASFGKNCDPIVYEDLLYDIGKKYNWALIGPESNGVGISTINALRRRNYRNVYYSNNFKPGVHKSAGAQEEWLDMLVDSILNRRLILRGEDTVLQLRGYRHDKMNERSQRSVVLDPSRKNKRRERHHWDKVSALMLAVAMAPRAPRRYKPVQQPENVVLLSKDMTWAQWLEYQERVATRRDASRPRRVHGRRR